MAQVGGKQNLTIWNCGKCHLAMYLYTSPNLFAAQRDWMATSYITAVIFVVGSYLRHIKYKMSVKVQMSQVFDVQYLQKYWHIFDCFCQNLQVVGAHVQFWRLILSGVSGLTIDSTELKSLITNIHQRIIKYQ